MEYKELLKCHGCKFKATIDGKSCKGKISVEDRIFLCQNVKKGTDCKDKQGYRYSWLYFYEDGSTSDFVTDFKLIEEEVTTPTKEQILEASKVSADAKAVLYKLFPQYFEEDLSVDVSEFEEFYAGGEFLICCRSGGEYKEKAFYLNKYEFNWELKEDSDGVLCLIPIKKK